MKTKLLISTLGLSFVLASPLMAATTGTVYQNGTSNSATVTQHDNWNASTAISVHGGHNTTNVAQHDNKEVTAVMNTHGYNNSSHIQQVDNDWGVEGRVDVFNGSNNYGYVETIRVADGKASIVVTNSTGNTNKILNSDTWVSRATISGYNAHSNQATIIQDNEGHHGYSYNLKASITQNNAWHNTAGIDQRGVNQDAAILQTGSHNTAGINQREGGWDANKATINQNGSYNQAFINQRGQNLTGTLTQVGTSNVAYLSQQ